jgi:uncharacterized protein YidB (DUF937 family)
MGLLDNLGELAGQLGGSQGATTSADPKAALVQAVLGMLVHGNEPGGLGGSGGIGGLGGLLQRFQNAGLGDHVASWVSGGANAAVSGDQIKAALGDGPLRILAEHAGLDEDQAAAHLSTLLPQLVDRLTPNGQVPAPGTMPDGGIAGVMESLGHLFTRTT